MNYKVGYIFFDSLQESLDTDFDYPLSESVHFKRTVPEIDDAQWKKWLGLQWDDVVTPNALIEVEHETLHPEVLDDENEKIKLVCRYAWISLMLTGSFAMDGAFFLTGSIKDGEVNIRQFLRYDRWFNPGEDFFVNLDDSNIKTWGKLFSAIQEVHSDEKNYRRLMKGIMCFQKACSESHVNFRLPYFVRSLEALILPAPGKTTQQFRARVSKFLLTLDIRPSPSQELNELLDRIYKLRCIFDHLHEIHGDYDSEDLLLCFQCEQLARNAYQYVLLNQDMLRNFSNDQSVKQYWEKMGT